MSETILDLRCLSIAVQSACLVTLVRRHLAQRYPVFWAFLLLSMAHSVWSLDRSFSGYVGDSSAFRWVLVAGYAAVAIEACMAQARHFRSLFSFTIGAMVAFVVLCAALGATICLTGPEILRDGGPVMLMCLACCVLLILSTAFFSTFPVAMRPNVRWHVLILELLLASEAVSTGLASIGSSDWRLVAEFVAAAGPLACYVLWTVKLVPAGECFMPLSEIPAEVLARLMAREEIPPHTPPAPSRRGLRWPRGERRLQLKTKPAPSDPHPGA